MSELYLIAHKVSGVAAFDVAERMECPECSGTGAELGTEPKGTRGDLVEVKGLCAECDSLGYWWIIPTSGHRAYPWWHWSLEATELSGWDEDRGKNLMERAGEMPPSLPDHYRHGPAPKVDIRALFKKARHAENFREGVAAFIKRRL